VSDQYSLQGNPAGDIALTIDPNGFAATASYDVRGRLIGQTAPSGAVPPEVDPLGKATTFA